MADAVSMLRQEITKLEQEVAKRRRALALLAARTAPAKSGGPAPKKNPTVKKAAPRPATGAPSLASRIMTYMGANKTRMLSSAQVAQALARSDKSVTRDNVQRRLGELYKAKKLRREDGRYGAA
ncbi:MAG: hypothetical protein FJ147_11945 [Deltaproteobacteria bacterium]|nr:hypothetical protein [Deltaproteobacteria bacterium]